MYMALYSLLGLSLEDERSSMHWCESDKCSGEQPLLIPKKKKKKKKNEVKKKDQPRPMKKNIFLLENFYPWSVLKSMKSFLDTM